MNIMTTMLRNFINRIPNKRSREHYCQNIKTYLSWLNGIAYVDNDVLEQDVEKYLTTEHDYTQDLINYTIYCTRDRKYAPKTTETHIKMMKQLLLEYEKPYNNRKIRRYTPEITTLTHDVPPDEEVVKKLILNAKPMMKSMLLFLTSGGMRIHELLYIRPEDITEKDGIGIVYLRKTKRRGEVLKPRTTLCTPECLHFYKEWMKLRNGYIDKSKNNYFSQYKKTGANGYTTYDKTDDGRIFPFSYTTVKRILLTTLKESELDKVHDGTNRHILHFHIFRKYFDTKCLMSDMKEVIRHLLMGHTIKGMDGIYCNPSVEMLMEGYKKAIPKLTILQDVEMRDQRDKFKIEVEGQRDSVAHLLKSQVKYETQLNEQARMIDEMNKKMRLFTEIQKEFIQIVEKDGKFVLGDKTTISTPQEIMKASEKWANSIIQDEKDGLVKITDEGGDSIEIII